MFRISISNEFDVMSDWYYAPIMVYPGTLHSQIGSETVSHFLENTRSGHVSKETVYGYKTLQEDLDNWLECYNNQKSPSGKSLLR